MKSPNQIIREAIYKPRFDNFDAALVDLIVEELYKAGYYFMWDSRRSHEYPGFKGD